MNINMKKNTIKLTESQLKKVIAESVKKVLKEVYTDDTKQLTRHYRGFDIYSDSDIWVVIYNGDVYFHSKSFDECTDFVDEVGYMIKHPNSY